MARDRPRAAGGEAGAQAGRVRALGERLEDHPLGVGAGRGGHGERAHRRRVAEISL